MKRLQAQFPQIPREVIESAVNTTRRETEPRARDRHHHRELTHEAAQAQLEQLAPTYARRSWRVR